MGMLFFIVGFFATYIPQSVDFGTKTVAGPTIIGWFCATTAFIASGMSTADLSWYFIGGLVVLHMAQVVDGKDRSLVGSAILSGFFTGFSWLFV